MNRHTKTIFSNYHFILLLFPGEKFLLQNLLESCPKIQTDSPQIFAPELWPAPKGEDLQPVWENLTSIVIVR